MFVYDLSGFKRGEEGFPIITYSVGNYGKAAAIIERVREQMWHGDPTIMPNNDENPSEPKDHPALIMRVFSADFAKDDIEYLIGDEEIDIGGAFPNRLYPRGESVRELYYRIIIDYRGPFTEGHRCSYCWRYDFGPGVFALMDDKRVTYSR